MNQFNSFIVSFGLAHRVVDGLGISIYRLFCIKNSLIVKGLVQERKLFLAINYGGPLISTALTLIFNNGGSSEYVVENLCTGKSRFINEIVLEYLASEGLEIETTMTCKTFVASVLVGMTLLELTCYLMIFHHCYKNDNGPIKNLLMKDETRKRNQRNAITLVGQIYGFVIEFSFMVGALVLTFESNMVVKEIGGVAAMPGYVIRSAVLVLTSEPIRKSILRNISD